MMYSVYIVAIMALVTILLRFLPFMVFSKTTPKPLEYLGSVLPYSVMAMLVVYCLKNVNFLEGSHGIPEFSCVALVILIHKLFHNTLLSILCGTAAYMIFVQVIFK